MYSPGERNGGKSLGGGWLFWWDHWITPWQPHLWQLGHGNLNRWSHFAAALNLQRLIQDLKQLDCCSQWFCWECTALGKAAKRRLKKQIKAKELLGEVCYKTVSIQSKEQLREINVPIWCVEAPLAWVVMSLLGIEQKPRMQCVWKHSAMNIAILCWLSRTTLVENTKPPLLWNIYYWFIAQI